MSLRCGILCVLGLCVCGGSAQAQFFTDQGMLSGSGLAAVPTASLAPAAEFRVQYFRLSRLDAGSRGLNVFGMSTGFTETLEGYARLSGEQSGTPLSQISYTFGGKFRYPGLLPVVRRLAVWAERSMSDRIEPSAVFPADAFRSGITVTFDSNGIHPSLFLGLSNTRDDLHPMVGAGVTFAVSHSAQLGVDLVHGYLGRNSAQISGMASFRVFSNVSLHVSPGYLASGGIHASTIAAGISCSSADIDFHPVIEKRKTEEFILPSIEELEKQEKIPDQKPGDSGHEPGQSGRAGSVDGDPSGHEHIINWSM